MPYSIQLTDAGRAYYDNRDRDLERGVVHLIERIGAENWQRRRQAVHDRYMAKLNARNTPVEGVSVRDREDESAWYLFLGETLIADPPAVDSDQAHRVWPYLSAFGRKLDAILAVGYRVRSCDGRATSGGASRTRVARLALCAYRQHQHRVDDGQVVV